MPGAALTTLQSGACRRVVAAFIERATTSEAIPVTLKLQSAVILSMIDAGQNFEQSEFDLLVWILDLYFEAFEYEDIDPYAEQAYAKLVGHWPFPTPPHDRIRDCDYLVGIESPNRKPHLGT